MKKQYNLTPEQEQRAAELRNMSPDAYEKLCKGCGLCCLCKTGTENLVFYTRLCCNYLDIKTKRCAVYNNRLKERKYKCAKVTSDLVLEGDLLPRTCGYVEYVFGPAEQPINLDWSMIKHCGNLDISDPYVGLCNIILTSINWKQR